MATFGGQTLTTTGDDPNSPLNLGTDSLMPDLGLLKVTSGGMAGQNPFGFTTLTGGQITGVDCDLIRGDVFQEIVQSIESATDKGNLTVEVQGDEVHNVIGTVTESVTGLFTLNVIAGWQESQQGPVNRWYHAKVLDIFDDDHHTDQPDSADFAVTGTLNSCVWGEQISAVGILSLQVVAGIALTVASLFDLEYKAWHAEYHLCHGEAKPFDLALRAMAAETTACHAEVKTQVAVRTSVTAGVDVDTAFPPV